MNKPKYVQLYNPRSGHYVKINNQEGGIVSHKKTASPYKNIPIIGKHKEELASVGEK